MAIANLHETLMAYKLRQSSIQLEINELQTLKNLAVYKQGDAHAIKSKDEEAVRNYFREMYDSNPDFKDLYIDYTQIPDFEEEMDKITAEYTDQMSELTAWETALDTQITTDSAELEEINAYIESIKSMLQNNIQDDFNYGMNQ